MVATPIGNMEDITLRALRILKEVDLIACEDTRTTRKLLSFYQIRTPVTSYFEGNKFRKGDFLVSLLKEGKRVALVTEAGTPGISDPGHHLVGLALENDIQVSPIPGPSALTAALSASGLKEARFYFHGFLPIKGRRRVLEGLKGLRGALVFYESPRRVLATLQDIFEVLGDRRLVLARELTKTFEEIMRGRVSTIMEGLKTRPVMGEVTLLVAGPDD